MPAPVRSGLVSLSNKRRPDVDGAQVARLMDGVSRELLHIRVQEATTVTEPIYMDSKAEIIAHYQQEFGGTARSKDGWHANLMRDLQAHGMSYAAAKKTLQPSRINQPGGRQKQWAEIGKTLPPKGYEDRQRTDLGGASAHVTATISFIISENYRDADINEELTPEQTARLLSSDDFGAVLSAYGLPTGNMSDLQIHDLTISI